MAKDPAFLFYPGDWLGGTLTFTRHQKGAYIDLLIAQFNQVALTIEDIKHILGNDFEVIWEVKLRSKFEVESDGKLYYNRKLRDEIIRRKMFCESRRNNREGNNQYSGHMTKHMSSHMETETIAENVAVNKAKKPTIEEVRAYCQERNNGVNPQKWHDFYTAKDWMIGKNKMKDWKAAVRTWEEKKELKKEWPLHPKSCTECFGNGYIIAPGSGGKFSCREVYK